MSAVLPHLEITPQRPHWVAGAPGFEPGNGGIEIRSPASRLTRARCARYRRRGDRVAVLGFPVRVSRIGSTMSVASPVRLRSLRDWRTAATGNGPAAVIAPMLGTAG